MMLFPTAGFHGWSASATLAAVGEGILSVAGVVEDVARIPRWKLSSIVTEAVLFCTLAFIFQMWVLGSSQPTAMAFVPLVMHRAFGLLVDIGMLTTGTGWAAPDAAQTSAAIIVARLVRLTDELGCFLCCVMGAFIVATNRFIGASGTSAKAIFFPLWLGTFIQLTVMAGFAISTIINSDVQMPYDAAEGARPRPRWRHFVSLFYSRVVIMLANCCTILLAVKLDSPSSLTWQNTMMCFYIVAAVLTFPLLVALLLSACITTSPSVSEPVARMQMLFSQVGIMTLLALLISTVMGLHGVVAFIDDADVSTANTLVAKKAIILPFLSFTVIVLGGTLFLFSGIVPKWRTAFAAQFGVPTPTSAMRALVSMGGAMGPGIGMLQQLQPAPTMLVKVGFHRYRRVQPGDDLVALRQQPAPPFMTPTHGAQAMMRSPALENAAARQPDPERGSPARAAGAAAGSAATTHASPGGKGRTNASLHRSHSYCEHASHASTASSDSSVNGECACVPDHARPRMRRARSLPSAKARLRPSPLSTSAGLSLDVEAPLSMSADRAPLSTATAAAVTPAVDRVAQVLASAAASPAVAATSAAEPPTSTLGTRRARRRMTLSTATPAGLGMMSPTSAYSCRICFAADSNAVLLECGHGGFCVGCCTRIINDIDMDSRRCPLCRAPIHHVLQIAPPQHHRCMTVPCKDAVLMAITSSSAAPPGPAAASGAPPGASGMIAGISIAAQLQNLPPTASASG